MLHGKQKKEGKWKQVRESSSKGLLLELPHFLGPGLPWTDLQDHGFLGLLGLKLWISYLFLQHKVASEPVLALHLLVMRESRKLNGGWFCVVLKNIIYKVGQLACWVLAHQAPPKAARARKLYLKPLYTRYFENIQTLCTAHTYIYVCMQKTFQNKF